MKYIINFFIIISFIHLVSCATLFKSSTEEVRFSSEPTNAKVYVNGQFMGETPFPLNLESNKNYSIITDPMLNTIRRELKKLASDIRTDNEQIKKVISQEIFKREILESEKAQEASKKIHYKIKKYQKAKDKVQEKKHTIEIKPEQQTQQSDEQNIDA